MKEIREFRGEYHFLSNFCGASVTFGGMTFRNNECAFQAQKTLNRVEKEKFCSIPPNEGKRLGGRVKLRADWEEIKDMIMYGVVRAKFMQNEELGRLLVGTEDAKLIEGNTWNDRYWGVCRGLGQNKLGKILMEVRSELVAKRL